MKYSVLLFLLARIAMAQMAGSDHIWDVVNPRSLYRAMSAENLFIPFLGIVALAENFACGWRARGCRRLLSARFVITSLAAVCGTTETVLLCYCALLAALF